MVEATEASEQRPVLIDSYLANAIEVDVDAIYDGSEIFIGIRTYGPEESVLTGEYKMPRFKRVK